MRSPSTVRKR